MIVEPLQRKYIVEEYGEIKKRIILMNEEDNDIYSNVNTRNG